MLPHPFGVPVEERAFRHVPDRMPRIEVEVLGRGVLALVLSPAEFDILPALMDADLPEALRHQQGVQGAPPGCGIRLVKRFDRAYLHRAAVFVRHFAEIIVFGEVLLRLGKADFVPVALPCEGAVIHAPRAPAVLLTEALNSRKNLLRPGRGKVELAPADAIALQPQRMHKIDILLVCRFVSELRPALVQDPVQGFGILHQQSPRQIHSMGSTPFTLHSASTKK